MAAIDDLRNEMTAMRASVDAAVAKLGSMPSGTPDTEIEAVVTEMRAAKDALDTALNPPPAV